MVLELRLYSHKFRRKMSLRSLLSIIDQTRKRERLSPAVVAQSLDEDEVAVVVQLEQEPVVVEVDKLSNEQELVVAVDKVPTAAVADEDGDEDSDGKITINPNETETHPSRSSLNGKCSKRLISTDWRN